MQRSAKAVGGDARAFPFAAMLVIMLSGSANGLEAAEETVAYARDIQPLLAAKCYACHGPDADARQAGLRLDRRAAAVGEAESGRRAIVAGQPDASELLRRVRSDDPDTIMPPPDAAPLTDAEIGILETWIAAGAPFQSHWAFQPPRRPKLPAVNDRRWVRNGIDHFVLARLEAGALAPNPPATPARLIRRLSLDLRGLPPSLEEAERFRHDESPDAYARLVDRMLASPRYGERKALVWLDLARYADSGGYQGDILREMWPWRDWVIRAYNANLPFDQFTLEQLAGDRLPNPTRDQIIATGFNRNHRINDEDGIIHEEFRVEYVADRLETTATVWMGLTVGCARCHDHKYDPISQREYYQLFAFFNSVAEQGRGHGNSPPLLELPTPEQRAALADFDSQLQDLESRLAPLASTDRGPDSSADHDAAQPLRDEIEALKKQRQQLAGQITTTMVMKDLPEPRETQVLIRGAYDQPGGRVSAATPRVLPSIASSPQDQGGTLDRLAFARWLLQHDHPLTARVVVDRVWRHHFGRGFTATPEDFGTRGDPPSHPALLDWLAVELIESGWDVKYLHRLIVTSATYRQSSRSSLEGLERDPGNQLLGRGPRHRLSAELVRDQALAASGLLVGDIGGPSVRPYQPEGMWVELASASKKYIPDSGAGLYRRSLYTFWRRTIPPPSMIAFDAPNREICQVRRPRSNTPLQSLVVLNSPIFIEAARKLAERTLTAPRQTTPSDPSTGVADDRRLTWMFRRVLVRAPDAVELKVLRASLQHFRNRYAEDIGAAQELLSVGASTTGAGTTDARELAAWTCVANVIFNLDEVVMKE